MCCSLTPSDSFSCGFRWSARSARARPATRCTRCSAWRARQSGSGGRPRPAPGPSPQGPGVPPRLRTRRRKVIHNCGVSGGFREGRGGLKREGGIEEGGGGRDWVGSRRGHLSKGCLQVSCTHQQVFNHFNTSSMTDFQFLQFFIGCYDCAQPYL